MDTSTTAQLRSRLALAAVIAAAAVWIGSAFVPAVLWAGVVAVAIEPLRRRLVARMPGRHATVAGILTTGITLVVVVPLALGVTMAAAEAGRVAQWVAGARVDGIPVPAWVAMLPMGAEQLSTWWAANLATPDAAAAHLARVDTAMVIERSRSFGQGLLARAVVFAFTIVVLFFLLRDRDAVARQLEQAAIRAFGPAGGRLGRQILASVRGTVDGLVLLGLAQGVLLALVYAIAGVPHPILLGLMSGVGSMVPFGLMLVMLVAMGLLAVQGAVVAAVVVGVLGFIINTVAENVIRPSLIGGATRLPFVWVLIGIIGGVETLGLLGLFVGPATMAALVLMWREWVEDGDLTTPEPGTPREETVDAGGRA